MLAARIIPCLDVDCGRVVKGVRFLELRDAGDPVERAKAYDSQGADEIMFLDIGASYRSRDILLEVVEKVSREVFVPLAVGGGIRSVDDIRKTLQAGADKVSICTAAVKHPPLLSAAAEVFGSQCVVLSIDAKRCGASWQVVINGGRQETGIDALEWARRGEELGAGEILLNSIDMDGTQAGYDLDLTRTVAEAVGIPVIASGGAGSLEQVADAIALGKADAVLLASLLHFGRYKVADIKKYLGDKGVTIRW